MVDNSINENKYVLEIKTVQIAPFRTLMTALKDILLETNIFGINKNLYNKVITVSFKKFLRPEKKFKSIKYLKKQIKIDIKQAKK